MQTTKQSNKEIILVIAGVFMFGFLVLLGLLFYWFSVNNQANAFEQAIITERDNNKNILSNYGKKLIEAAQITDMQREDFSKIISDQMSGRYGPEGSKAMVQWIHENNKSLDTTVYTRLQSLIESGRNEFRSGQTKMLSLKQGYTTILGSVPRGFIMRIIGYPKINLEEFEIVSDDRTESAFSSHKEEAIKLRN